MSTPRPMTFAAAWRRPVRLFVLLCLGLAGSFASAGGESGTGQYRLRGYGEFSDRVARDGEATIHRLRFADAEHARIFASKLFADFELTPGNRVVALAAGGGPADALDLGGGGWIVPLLAPKGREAVVLTAPNQPALAAALAREKLAPLRRAELSHPPFMDKWDRHPLGVWQASGDFSQDRLRKDLDSFYAWLGSLQLNVQLNVGRATIDGTVNDNVFSWLRQYFAQYDVKYQWVEWLIHRPDVYNRNPFLAPTLNPHVATQWNYYGENRVARGPLRDVQNATYAGLLRTLVNDPRQMAILDPDGEIGPFADSVWGASGPVTQREFARFLREVRGLSLAELSRRYTGKPGSYASWEDVPLADWREFYGWTPGALDLAGEWRFLRDDRGVGHAQGWALPGFDDSDWVRLYYPGDALVFGLAGKEGPLWMRQTITVPPGSFTGKAYLSVAPLSAATVQVFINGAPAGNLDPRFHTARTWGQFDVSAELARQPVLTVALRFAAGDTPNGPIFLTGKQIEEFPTADPRLNAKRWDWLEFADWATAESVASTLRSIRAVDPDRPIKVHAYSGSPWGWRVLAAYGGYSHHTGSGPGWHYTEPKQLGAARNLQDSSEPGGPMDNLRELKGLFGNLIYMGKNAHDYFINLQSITRDPAMQAWFEAKLPAIKVMGRANVRLSPIAVINGLLNTHYQGEFARWESWRYGIAPGRGGELIPLLDEVRLREGNLGRFRAIVDPDTECWDEAMTTALRTYVEQGGVLVLNRLCGRGSFLARGPDDGPGPALAGVRLGRAQAASRGITFAQAVPLFADTPGLVRTEARYGVPDLALELLPGTEVLATWSDGSAAVTRRAVGKGSVYFYGGSIYPPGLAQGLAKVYGPEVYVSVEGGADLWRTLESNNGCEDLLMVRGKGDRPATVRWTFDYPPQGIYDPVTGQPVEARLEGRTATFTATIPDWDFAWFAARRPNAGANLAHWLARQGEIWSGTAPGQAPPELSVFRRLDLNHGWQLAQVPTFAEAEARRQQGDGAAGLQPTQLWLWGTPGSDPKPGLAGLYRRDFELPKPWLRPSEFQLLLRGQIHDTPVHGFLGKSAIYLNGTQLWQGDRLDSVALDVTGKVTAGRNRLEIVHQGKGVMASVQLLRSAVPESRIDLAGPWQAILGQQEERPQTLPAERFPAACVYRDVVVPESARNQEVWLRVEGSCGFVMVNGRTRYANMTGPPTYAPDPAYEVDITPDVRFGQPNRIVLNGGWRPGEMSIRRAELACYRPGAWAADGKGTRQALSAKELAAVARDLAVIQNYPLVHAPVAKPQPVLVPPESAAKPLALPPVLLDLDLHPAQGPVVDRGPHAVPVTVKGSVEPFTEAGGRIAGAYLRNEADPPGTLILPPGIFRQRLAGKSATLRAWVKPMVIDRPNGALFGWLDYLFAWRLNDSSCLANLSDPPKRQLIAESIVRPRAWQCLTLVVDGPKATLYADGIAVGTQSWNKPIVGTDAPLAVGSIAGVRDFLNAKLAAFTIYEGALPAEDVARLYLQERERFVLPPEPGPEDDLLCLVAGAGKAADSAEIRGQVAAAPGVTVQRDDGGPCLAFDGAGSHLLLRDHPRAKYFAEPFSLVLELRREAGAAGMVFRRHHILCLELKPDGTVIFDANIGRNNRASFPAAVPAGRWVRLMLTYDRQTVRLFRDGELLGEKAYPGRLDSSDYPVSIFADNTRGQIPSYNLRAELREFRLIPRVLAAMPPAAKP